MHISMLNSLSNFEFLCMPMRTWPQVNRDLNKAWESGELRGTGAKYTDTISQLSTKLNKTNSQIIDWIKRRMKTEKNKFLQVNLHDMK